MKPGSGVTTELKRVKGKIWHCRVSFKGLQEKYATVEWLVHASWPVEMVTPMKIKSSTTENSNMSYNIF